MSKKGGNFFEEHIEKMVLAVVGIVCIWILITRVLLSPNYVKYENKKFSSGNIDNYISEQAKLLRDKLDREPGPMQAYKLRLGDFTALVDSAVRVDVNLSLPQPNKVMEANVKRAYHIPRIGKVSEVEVEHIRAAAYVPVERINEENIYDKAETEVNDIDFVTVEAKFDVAQLCGSFYESFAGENVPDQWCDPCLANPTFAAVQLQRQELLAGPKHDKMSLAASADSGWSNWQVMPRTRVDHRKKMFEVIEEVGKLPVGGIKVRLLQFDDAEVRIDLLQPVAYKIASAKEDWFPPLLHKKFVRRQQVLEAQEKREARVAERQERDSEREKARAERSSRTPKTRTRSTGGEYDEYGMDEFPDDSMPSRRSTTRRTRSERLSEKERPEKSREAPKTESIDDIYSEFDEILISGESDLAGIREPLMFWAHDDTVEPGKSYRYRIRLGVFNPIAGMNQFSERDKRFKSEVILWSEFSDVTEAVEIPRRLYFFPRQEAARTVTVMVCRYALGYWYSKDFTVKKGEVIGKVIGSEPVEAEEKGVTVPETIDYATGAVLVDVVPVNDWSGGKNLRARHYFDMLYSFGGAHIERIPIKTRYWPEELQVKFSEIKKSEKEPKEPLRDWGTRRRERRRPTPGLEYDELDEEFMDYY